MSIEEFIKTHTPLVYSIVKRSKFKTNLDQDDISELVHIGLWKAWKKHNPERGKVSTLITTVIRNMIFDKVKKKSRYKERMVSLKDHLIPLSYQDYHLFEYMTDEELTYCENNEMTHLIKMNIAGRL